MLVIIQHTPAATHSMHRNDSFHSRSLDDLYGICLEIYDPDNMIALPLSIEQY